MKDLTQGSIPRQLLGLSAFLAVSMLLQTLYFLVDLYFVSRLGGAAIAGVGLAGNVMFITMALTQMLAVGATTLIAQAAGRRDQADAQAVFDQTCALSLAAGALVFGLGLMLRVPYCRALAADEATFRAAADYLRWTIPAFALQFGLVAIGSALRAGGIVKPGMVIQMGTVALNAALAPVFVLGWGTGQPLGAAGAGLATFCSVTAGVAALGGYFVRASRFVHLRPGNWRIDKRVAARLLGIGLPAGGEFLLFAAYTALVYWIIRVKGADAQAGFGVGTRLMQSMFLPVMAISMGASPLAAQNFGARKFDRVRQAFRTACLMAVGLMLGMTLLARTTPETMIRWFAQEAAVIGHATVYLRVVSWGFVAYGLSAVFSSLFQALGNTWPVLGTTALRVGLFTALAFWIARDPGFALEEVWWAATAMSVVQTGAGYLLLQREFHRKLAV